MMDVSQEPSPHRLVNSETSIEEAALRYAERRLPVFPVSGKEPLTTHGFKDATTNLDTIRAWWSKWPKANVAIPTGSASGLVVIDIDPRHGGDKSLAALEERHGLLPQTLESRTGGGGRHLFFAYDSEQKLRNSVGKLGHGLDVRADGGYVVVPPSRHPKSKRRYIWTNRAEPLAAPAWLIDPLDDSGGRTAGQTSEAHALEGGRNSALASLAGSMRRRGMSQSSIAVALLEENATRCLPPLSEEEVVRIAHSVSRYSPQNQAEARSGACHTISRPNAVTRAFSDIVPQPLRWLWPARIPLGKLTLFIGDPGVGKSLMAIDVASRISRGASFPDGAECEPGSVVLLSAEDDPADTIRPRLDAAGADVSRIHILEAVRVSLQASAAVERAFNLEEDIDVLEQTVSRIPDVRVVIVDPLSAYLGRIDAHKNAQVRGLLAPLSALAARRSVAIILVTHLRKSSGTAVHRAIESIAFAAAARAVWAVGPDPDDPEQRLMLPVKQSLAADRGGLAFRIRTQNGTGRVEWQSGSVCLDADDVLSGLENGQGRNSRREAESWLHELLTNGPLPVKEIQADAKDAGLSWMTVRRAKNASNIVARKTGFCDGWTWHMPGAEDAQSAHSGLSALARVPEAKWDTKSAEPEGAQQEKESASERQAETSALGNVPDNGRGITKSRPEDAHQQGLSAFEEGEL